MLKKMLSGIMATMLAVCALPAAAFAEQRTEVIDQQPIQSINIGNDDLRPSVKNFFRPYTLRGLLLESTRSTLQRAAFGNTVFGTQKFAPTTTTPRGVTVVPWNSMATEFVQQILRKGERLSQRNGRFSGPQMMIVIGIVFAINRLY